MTLPFISYGGSSLISLAFGMGMLIALSRKRPGAAALAALSEPRRKAEPRTSEASGPEPVPAAS
jgi:cell division protein FtsW